MTRPAIVATAACGDQTAPPSLVGGSPHYFLEVNVNDEWDWLGPSKGDGVLKAIIEEIHPDSRSSASAAEQAGMRGASRDPLDSPDILPFGSLDWLAVAWHGVRHRPIRDACRAGHDWGVGPGDDQLFCPALQIASCKAGGVVLASFQVKGRPFMQCVARSFRKTVFTFCLILISQDARPEALNAGLQQRIEKTSAEVKHLETERAESAALLGRGEALLAKARDDGDEASVPIIEMAIAKARSAIAACDAGITAAKGRVESLTGIMQTIENMSAATEVVIPASVVDLRDVKDFTIDPAKVSGYAGGMHGRLTAEKATAVHEEIRTRALGRTSGSNLATMSYAELMASLDGEAREGLKEGMQEREREVDQKLRRAFHLPEDSDEELIDLILPPDPAKPSPLHQAMQSIKDQALRLLHAFDRVQHDEKERVFEVYQAWKAGTEKLMNQMDGNQLSATEYEEANKLLDARFLFTLTVIGKAADTKENEKIAAELPEGDNDRIGGVK